MKYEVSTTYHITIGIDQNKDKGVSVLTTSELLVLLARLLLLFVVTAQDAIILEQSAVGESQFIERILACLCCEIELRELPLESIEFCFGKHS